MSKISKLLKAGVFTLAFLYCGILALLYLAQDSLIFPAPSASVETLPEYAAFEEMQTSDGTLLRHVRLRGDEGAPKLMFFHGNGALASYEIERGRILQENGFDVLLVEYRGYGGSGGTASADAILKDSLEVYDWYSSDENDWVFLYGHSLGSGIASYVASQRPSKYLALEAPFTKLSDIAASNYPMFPVRSLLKHEIATQDYLATIKTPVLIIHGTNDRVVPYHFGEALYQTLDAENTVFQSVDEAGHNNLVSYGSIDMVLQHFSKVF